MALSELGIGQDAVVSKLDLPEEVQHHLMHMGFIPEARVTALRRAPAGDPTVYESAAGDAAIAKEGKR
jgi:ferrous iron transport protein A